MPHTLRGITKLPLASYPGSFPLAAHVDTRLKALTNQFTYSYSCTPIASGPVPCQRMDLVHFGVPHHNSEVRRATSDGPHSALQVSVNHWVWILTTYCGLRILAQISVDINPRPSHLQFWQKLAVGIAWEQGKAMTWNVKPAALHDNINLEH